MANGARVWYAQLILLCKRQVKLARRQPLTSFLLIFAPVFALIPLILLKWTAGSFSRPECHKRPIAMPLGTHESAARYLQSVFCGFDGFDLMCMSERERQTNPNIYYERSILPLWWSELLPLVSNETNTREFSQLLASSQVFLDADSNWHGSATVRKNVIEWVHEFEASVRILSLSDVSHEETDGANSSGEIYFGNFLGSFTKVKLSKNQCLWKITNKFQFSCMQTDPTVQLHYVLKKAQKIVPLILDAVAEYIPITDNATAITTYAFLQSLLFGEDVDSIVAHAIITRELRSLADTGLFDRNGLEAFIMQCSVTKVFLRDAMKITMRHWSTLVERLEVVKQILYRSSSPSSATIPPATLFAAMYKTSVCGVDIVEQPKSLQNTDRDGSEKTSFDGEIPEPQQRSKMGRALESLADVLAETRFDAEVVNSMLKSLMGPEQYAQQMPRELFAIQALLDRTFSNTDANRTRPQSSSYSPQHVCSSFEREASRLVLGNMFYSMVKPITTGQILYAVPDKFGTVDDADAILKATNEKLRSIRLTLSYPLQVLNLFTNIGYARQAALSPRHDRLLTKIISKAIRRVAVQMDGGDAGAPMSMDDLTQLLQRARDLISEVVVWLRQVLNIQKVITDKCLPWQSNVYAERIDSIDKLEKRARNLEAKRELLSAVLFSESKDPAASGPSRRVSYELQMDLDRLKALPSMSGPMDELLANGSIVGDIQFYLNFLPLQNILDRSIMEHYATAEPSPKNSSSPSLSDAVYIEAFPRPCSNSNTLSFILQRSFQHLLIMLGIAFGTGVMTRQIVADRERVLDRLLRLHGLRVGVRSCSWWLTWLFLWSLVAVAILLFQSFNGMLPYSNVLLQFLTLWSIFACNMAFNYAIAAFFDRPVLAAGVSVSMLVFSLVPSLFRLANSYTLSWLQVILLNGWPMVPLLSFVIYSTRYESAQTGLQFSNWMYSTEMWDGFSPRSIFFIVLCYTAAYIAVGAIVRLARDVMNHQLAASACVPWWNVGQWFGCSSASANERPVGLTTCAEISRPVNTEAGMHGKIDTNTVACAIRIRHVTKVYKKTGFVTWFLRCCRLGQSLQTVGRSVSSESDSIAGDSAEEEVTQPVDGHLAVSNVSLMLRDNEIACVVGPNGAGKSTLMALMCGFLHPTSGTIELYDESLHTARARNIIGYCPQVNVLLERMTVREHLEFFASLKGFTGQRRKRQVDSAIRRMELEPFAWQYAQTLSGGYQRRLMMALAFACGDNRLIVLDEPCAGVDPAARHELWQLIARQRQAGYTVVVNTHHLQEAECFADRVVIMKSGKVCVVESMRTLCESYTGGTLHTADADNNITRSIAALNINNAEYLHATRVDAAACLLSPLTQPVWQLVVDTLLRDGNNCALVTNLVRSAFPSATLAADHANKPQLPPAKDNNHTKRWRFNVRENYSAVKKKALLQLCLTMFDGTPVHRNADNSPDQHSSNSELSSSSSSSSATTSPVPPPTTGCCVVAVHFNTPTLEDVCKAVQMDKNAADDDDDKLSSVCDKNYDENIYESAKEQQQDTRGMSVYLPNNTELIELPEVHNNSNSSSSSAFVTSCEFITPLEETPMQNANKKAKVSHAVNKFGFTAAVPTAAVKGPTRFARIIKAVVHTRLLASSLVMRQAFALSCKRLIHYSRTYRRTGAMLAIPLAMIFVGTLVARSTQRSPTDNRVPPFKLDPISTFWSQPIFYAHEDYDADVNVAGNYTRNLIHILQNDVDFNSLSMQHCSRCQSSVVRGQQMRQLKQRWLNSLGSSSRAYARASDTGHGCMPLDDLQLPAATTIVKSVDTLTTTDGIVAVHVNLPRSEMRRVGGGSADSVEDVMFIKPRNTLLPQMFGGYSIVHAHAGLTNQHNSSYITVWHNTAMGWAPAQFLARLNAAIFKLQHPGTEKGMHLEAFVRPLPLTRAQIELGGTEKVTLDTAATMMFVFGMTFVPAFAIAYIVAERQRGERKVQLLGGVSSSTYWITSSLFDYLLLYSLVVFGAWLILTVWHIDSFSYHDGYFDALFAVIAVYGLNALAMSYLLSYLFHDPHVAFVSVYALLCCAGFVSTLLVNPDNFYGQLLRDKHKYRIEDDRMLMWLVPSYNMGQAIVRMLTQKFESFGFKKVLCSAMSVHQQQEEDGDDEDDLSGASTDAVQLCERALARDPFEWNTAGRHISVMAVSTVVCLVTVIGIEWLSENWSAVVGAAQWSYSKKDLHANNNRELRANVDSGVENTNSDNDDDSEQSDDAAKFPCLTQKPDKSRKRRRRSNQTMTDNDDDDYVVKCERVWHSYKVSKWRRLRNASQLARRHKARSTAACSGKADKNVVTESLSIVGSSEIEAARMSENNNNENVVIPSGMRKVGGVRERDHIAKNVSITVRKGESCALFGYNGAGKTTVFRCLTGQVTPLRGRIIFNCTGYNRLHDAADDENAEQQHGQNLSSRRSTNTSSPLAGFIGYCPQTEPLEEHCTIYEHLLLYSLMKGVQINTLALQIGHVLRYVAIGREFLHGPVAQSLSGGTRRKLSAAMALINRPRLVLMDEATAGVDALAREAVARTLAGYAREQRAAVVFTSHNVADACASSRIAVLSNGRIVLDESLEAINSRFLGRFFHVKIFFKIVNNINYAGNDADLANNNKHPLTISPKKRGSANNSASGNNVGESTPTVSLHSGRRRDSLDSLLPDGGATTRVERILHRFYAVLCELDFTVHSHQMSGRMLQMIIIAPPLLNNNNSPVSGTPVDDSVACHNNVINAARRRGMAKVVDELRRSPPLAGKKQPKIISSADSPLASTTTSASFSLSAQLAQQQAAASVQMQLYRLFFDVCHGNISVATKDAAANSNVASSSSSSDADEASNHAASIEEFSIEPSSTEQILAMLASENDAMRDCGGSICA